MSAPLVRNVSDTALWMATMRARESERADALFKDPHARALGGTRGEQILASVPPKHRNEWAYVARTLLFDKFLLGEIARGADTVVNLAAGLDARPYRLELPPSLRWFELDLPELIDYKNDVLREAKPVCRLERIGVDLANPAARREVFERIGREAKNAVVASEGLLIYLSAEENAMLAGDLAAQPSFRSWAIDMVSPGLLRMVQKQVGTMLANASAPLKFAPEEGWFVFRKFGWEPAEIVSNLRFGAQIKRVPWLMRLFARFPDPKPPLGSRPWGGVVLFRKEDQGS